MAGKATSPFDDDDDVTVDELNERDAKKVRAAAKDPVDRSKETEETREFSIDEEPEDPEPRTSVRQEKKQNRFREAQEKARAAEERATRAEREAELERVQRTTIETNWRLDQERQAREKTPGPNKFDEEAKSLWDENNRLVQQFAAEQKAGTLTEEKAAQIRERSRQINERRMELVVEKREAANPRREEQPRNRMAETVAAHLELHHPDIAADARAGRFLAHEQAKLVLKGEPDNLATLEKAADNTRRELGMGGAKPTRSQQRRATGISASGGGGLHGEESRAPRTMVPTKAQKRMATSMYPGLSEEQAVQRWVSKVGRKIMEEQNQDDA